MNEIQIRAASEQIWCLWLFPAWVNRHTAAVHVSVHVTVWRADLCPVRSLCFQCELQISMLAMFGMRRCREPDPAEEPSERLSEFSSFDVHGAETRNIQIKNETKKSVF